MNKDECLDRTILVGQESLRCAVDEYMDHYHGERNHQGLENRLIHLPTVAYNRGIAAKSCSLALQGSTIGNSVSLLAVVAWPSRSSVPGLRSHFALC